ncbi:hypothetical protein, partial [Rhodoblastus sp.]|uniref:hypothetical protein n=1 Tax=Rhodoblastus sp. TaxID=1962975 RepID=UPI0035B054B6
KKRRARARFDAPLGLDGRLRSFAPKQSPDAREGAMLRHLAKRPYCCGGLDRRDLLRGATLAALLSAIGGGASGARSGAPDGAA